MNYRSKIINKCKNIQLYNAELSEVDELISEFQILEYGKVSSLKLVTGMRVYGEVITPEADHIFTASIIGENTSTSTSAKTENAINYRLAEDSEIQEKKYSIRLDLSTGLEYLITFTVVFTIVNKYGLKQHESPPSTRVFYMRHGPGEAHYSDSWCEDIAHYKRLINNLFTNDTADKHNSTLSTGGCRGAEHTLANPNDGSRSYFEKLNTRVYPELIDPVRKYVTGDGEDYACSVNLLLNNYEDENGPDRGFIKIWHRAIDDQADSFIDIPGGGTGYVYNGENYRQNSIISAIRQLIEQSSYLLTLDTFSLKYWQIITDYRPQMNRNAIYCLGQIVFSKKTLLSKLYALENLNYQIALPGPECKRNVFRSVDCGNQVVGQFTTSVIKSIHRGLSLAKSEQGTGIRDCLKTLSLLNRSIKSMGPVEAKDWSIIQSISTGFTESEVESLIKFICPGIKSMTLSGLTCCWADLGEFASYELLNKLINIGRVHRFSFDDTELVYTYFKTSLEFKFGKLILNRQDTFLLKDLLWGAGAVLNLIRRSADSDCRLQDIFSMVIYKPQKAADLLSEKSILSEELLWDDHFLHCFKKLVQTGLSSSNLTTDYSKLIKALDSSLLAGIFNIHYLCILYNNQTISLREDAKVYRVDCKTKALRIFQNFFVRSSITTTVSDTYHRKISISYPLQQIPLILSKTDTRILQKYFSGSECTEILDHRPDEEIPPVHFIVTTK